MADPTAPAPAAAAPAAAPGAAAPAPGAAPAAAPAKPDGSIVADAQVAAAPAPLEDVKAYLTARGIKPEDMAGLQEAQLRAKYDQEKAAEAKPADGKEKTGADEIDLKAPEGFTFDEKTLADFKGVLADANLSPTDRGNKLLEMHAAALKAAVQQPLDLWAETQAKWQGEVKADPEMGGKNFDSTRELIAKAIDVLGGKEAQKVREAFDYTGAGNHPEIVRVMRRAGQLVAEGKHVAGNPSGQDGAGPKSAAQTLYPTHA